MPYCELLSTCPFFNSATQDSPEMADIDKEQYCQGNYTWCGRYMAFQALKRELEKETAVRNVPK